MATPDPVLTALARLEERFVERMDESRRELRLDLDGHFDVLNHRLDRLARLMSEISRRDDAGRLSSRRLSSKRAE